MDNTNSNISQEVYERRERPRAESALTRDFNSDDHKRLSFVPSFTSVVINYLLDDVRLQTQRRIHPNSHIREQLGHGY